MYDEYGWLFYIIVYLLPGLSCARVALSRDGPARARCSNSLDQNPFGKTSTMWDALQAWGDLSMPSARYVERRSICPGSPLPDSSHGLCRRLTSCPGTTGTSLKCASQLGANFAGSAVVLNLSAAAVARSGNIVRLMDTHQHSRR